MRLYLVMHVIFVSYTLLKMRSEFHSFYVSLQTRLLQIGSDVMNRSEFHSVFDGVTNLTKFHYYIASCISTSWKSVLLSEDKRIVLRVHFLSVIDDLFLSSPVPR